MAIKKIILCTTKDYKINEFNKLLSNYDVKHPALKGKAWVKSSCYLIYSKGRGEFRWNAGVFR